MADLIRPFFATVLLTVTALAHAGPPELTPAVLHKSKAKPASLVSQSGDTVTLTATGREAYLGRDGATFAGIKTDASHFTFIARIKSMEGRREMPKVGLCVRETLTDTARSVHLRYDDYEGNRCLQWFMRYLVRPNDADASRQSFHAGTDKRFADPEGLWLKIERRYPFVHVSASRDGDKWDEVAPDYKKVLLAQTVHVGPIATQGGGGKPGLKATFDNISFKVDKPNDAEGVLTQDAFQEYRPELGKWRMIVRTAQFRDTPFTCFLIMPEKMKPSEIKGILLSSGSKEVPVNAAGTETLAFEKKGERLRQPVPLGKLEGELLLDQPGTLHTWYASQGWVRLGGAFPAKFFDDAVTKLATVEGFEHLENLPFVATGSSFAGGISAQVAQLYPERCVATAPVIIGQAGAKADNPALKTIPHINLWGDRDGSHFREATRNLASLPPVKAQFANAPLWAAAHRHMDAQTMAIPFFREAYQLRVPDDFDPKKGPIELKKIPYDAGYYGVFDEWKSNAPTIVPVDEYEGDTKDLNWLPNRTTARIWQAFVSYNPRPIIAFPVSDGGSEFMGPIRPERRNHQMQAGVPFPIVGAGPVATDDGEPLQVRYFINGRPLKTTPVDGHPYHVTAEPVEPGLHSLWIETYVKGSDEPVEISRPETILFLPEGGGEFWKLAPQ